MHWQNVAIGLLKVCLCDLLTIKQSINHLGKFFQDCHARVGGLGSKVDEGLGDDIRRLKWGRKKNTEVSKRSLLSSTYGLV